MGHTLIVTDKGDAAISRLKKLELINSDRYCQWETVKSIMELGVKPFNDLCDDRIDRIFVDCSADFLHDNNNFVAFDASEPGIVYQRRQMHIALGNANVQIHTFTSREPEQHVVKVAQLPQPSEASRNIVYELTIAENTMLYSLNESGEWELDTQRPSVDTAGADHVFEFIRLLRHIVCSYHHDVAVVVECNNIGRGKVSTPVVRRDITFDNTSHNIVIHV